LLPIRAGLDLNREHPFSFSSFCPRPPSLRHCPRTTRNEQQETTSKEPIEDIYSLLRITMMTPISTNRIHTVRLLSGRMRESKIITTVSEIYHTFTWTSPLWLDRDFSMSYWLITKFPPFKGRSPYTHRQRWDVLYNTHSGKLPIYCLRHRLCLSLPRVYIVTNSCTLCHMISVYYQSLHITLRTHMFVHETSRCLCP
jgi:hypothetical protein